MIEDYRIEKLRSDSTANKCLLRNFLARHSLEYEEDIEVVFGIFNTEDQLVGCGCAAGALMKCFAVDEELRGQNALGGLVSALIQERYAAGFYDLFVITRSHNEPLFQGCGLHTIARTDALVMLENQMDGPGRFASSFIRPNDPTENVGALVMNCNPFTKGHRALVEYASERCNLLHIFVVEENCSAFPTAVRYRLVQKGTADLSNVRVHLSSHYMISRATFPTYFLKQDEDAASLQAELDVSIFALKIAPVLHITRRFVGQEPFDPVTARYNETLKRILPAHGIELVEIPRIKEDGQIISASRVRALLKKEGVCPEVLALVPQTTAYYLQNSLSEVGL